MSTYLTNQGKGKWRFLALILPLSTWVLAETTIEYLMLLPSLVYAAIVIFRGSLTLEYYTYRISFQRCCKILVGLYVVAALFGQVEILSLTNRSVMEANNLLLFGILYLLSGCILLRELRMGMDYGAQERSMGNLQMAAILGGSGAVLVGFMYAREQLQQWSLQLLRILWFAVGSVIAFLGWVIEMLFGDGLKAFFEELNPVETTEGPTAALPEMTGTGEYTEPVVEQGYPWWLAILIVAAMVVLLIILVRTFRNQTKAPSSQDVSEQVSEPKPQSKESRSSNRSKVRRYYRDYLKSQRKKGLRLQTNQTSQDILDGIRPDTNPEAASQLRDVYIAARYDETREVTPEQVRQAKSALKRTKE